MTRTIFCLGFCFAPLFGQLAAPNAKGVSIGHLHLRSQDTAGHRKFWVDTLGATVGKVAQLEVYKIPGVIVMVQKGDAKGGTEGSTINHLGFVVKDLDAAIARCKEGGYEIPRIDQEARQIFVMAPDGIKVELTEDKKMSGAIAHHHIHFYTDSVEESRAWYVKQFGAVVGMRGKFAKADVPGGELSFSKADAKPVGTKGRGMDHIGFEVKGLEEFVKGMEADGVKFDVPYRKVPALGIAIAFFTDPWGTYVELTEGLVQF